MKILHVCGGMEIGGAQGAIYQLVKCQRESGIEADILSTSQKSFYARKVSELNATVHWIGQKGGTDFTCAGKYLSLARKYDLIHFHGTNPALILTSLFLSRGQRLFYTHRGGDHKFPLRRYLSHRVSGFCMKYKFDGISGNTHHAAKVASNLFRIPEEGVIVTYNGIYFDLLEPRRDCADIFNELGVNGRNTFFVGTTAKLIDCKRIDFLIRAISVLEDLPIACLVIGDGPKRPFLESLAKDLGLQAQIFFLGQKEYVADYLSILDIFVLPSNSSESFGNAVVEAMSFGIPSIVMRDGGGLLEHVPKDADLVAADLADLAKHIRSFIESPMMASELGAKGQAYVRNKYSVSNMKKGYDRLYLSTRV